MGGSAGGNNTGVFPSVHPTCTPPLPAHTCMPNLSQMPPYDALYNTTTGDPSPTAEDMSLTFPPLHRWWIRHVL
jgi:hypothetical protein